MGVSQKSVSGKTFQTPLLHTIYEITGGRSSISVSHNDVYSKCAKKAEVSIEQFGKDPSGNYKVKKWIQEAAKTLRKHGKLKLEKKGFWSLTKAGIEEMDRSPYHVLKDSEVEFDSSEKKFSEEGNERLRSSSPYHEEDFIINIACDLSRCFGHFLPNNDICKSCPILEECLLERLSKDNSFIQRIDDKFIKANWKVDYHRGPFIDIRENEFTYAKMAMTESTCGICRLTIPQGSNFFYSKIDGKNAFIHPSCKAKYDQKQK